MLSHSRNIKTKNRDTIAGRAGGRRCRVVKCTVKSACAYIFGSRARCLDDGRFGVTPGVGAAYQARCAFRFRSACTSVCVCSVCGEGGRCAGRKCRRKNVFPPPPPPRAGTEPKRPDGVRVFLLCPPKTTRTYENSISRESLFLCIRLTLQTRKPTHPPSSSAAVYVLL